MASAVRVLTARLYGRCDTAPALEIGHNFVDHATLDKVKTGYSWQAIPMLACQCAVPDYEGFDAYTARQGVFDTSKETAVVMAIGRAVKKPVGGRFARAWWCRFPIRKKWGLSVQTLGPRYLAVNGDVRRSRHIQRPLVSGTVTGICSSKGLLIAALGRRGQKKVS